MLLIGTSENLIKSKNKNSDVSKGSNKPFRKLNKERK